MKKKRNNKKMEIDYKNLKEITVTTQEELDNIPLDFEGQIIINGGTIDNKIKIENDYNLKLKVINNSYVWVYENNFVEAFAYSYVFAHDNSTVESYEDSHIFAQDNSNIVAHKNSFVEASDNSCVLAYDNSCVLAYDNSWVKAYKNSHIKAYENSYVKAYDNSHIKVYEDSYVKAYNNSYIEAHGNSYVKDYDNSQIEAYGNAQILDMQQGAEIKILGNSRIIYTPKNINEFMDFYEIKHTKTKAIFYKAVHKDESGIYRADYDKNFIYEIGKYKTEICDENINTTCSHGINISTLDYALDFGNKWNDTAILEVETNIKDIVMPISKEGKVRTSKVKVLREILL